MCLLSILFVSTVKRMMIFVGPTDYYTLSRSQTAADFARFMPA